MSILVKEIVVNCGPRETRVCILENGELVELFIEAQSGERLVGNIYKGKVANVLPGMQAAFVNVGLPKNTFLYVDDALENVVGVDDLPDKITDKSSINDVVKPNQAVIVQVSKEPFGTKGARVTRHITMPGRFVVLMPTVDYVGISRRITNSEERERLKELAQEFRPKGMGIIVRTMAEGINADELKRDIDFLGTLWKRIKNKAKTAKAPALLHRDLNLLYRIIRDSFDNDVLRLIIDSPAEYESVLSLLEDIAPQLKDRVFLFQQNRPIFEIFGLESQIDKLMRNKVWLKCGGYIVIDQTEALTSIDVNTGKYVGSTNLADTVLKTNLEAAREIARQLRLRNIGGIIIIDFIDMDNPEHRRKVLSALTEATSADKTKTSILGLTQLGLVEMTRQKVRQGVAQSLQKTCPCCEGTGRIPTEEVALTRIETELCSILASNTDAAVLVHVHPNLAGNLIGINGANLERLEKETCKKLYIQSNLAMGTEDYRIVLTGTVEEVEKIAIPVAVGEIHTRVIDCVHHSRSQDGIAKFDGFVVQVEHAAALVGRRATFEITKVYKTFAKAKLFKR